MDITKAHGHDTTKNDNALYSQLEKFSIKLPDSIGGIIARTVAIVTTIGV